MWTQTLHTDAWQQNPILQIAYLHQFLKKWTRHSKHERQPAIELVSTLYSGDTKEVRGGADTPGGQLHCEPLTT